MTRPSGKPEVAGAVGAGTGDAVAAVVAVGNDKYARQSMYFEVQ